MISNTDLIGIGKALQAASSVLLFPHNHPDADAIGSCVALCRIARQLGKESWVVLEEDLSKNLDFLDDGYCIVGGDDIEGADVVMAVDCSDPDRFGVVRDIFDKGKLKIALDHHRTKKCDLDLYYIDPGAASNTENVYKLLKEMDWDIDSNCAEALYTGLVTDTGSFKHSNTTPDSHRIAADLIEAGADVNNITVNLFLSTDPRTVAVEADILGRIELFADGKAAMVSLSQEQLRQCNAKMEHADHIIDLLTRIDKVEIACTLKEQSKGISLSLRSKTYGDVRSIAEALGGGGHTKAAGSTLRIPLKEAYDLVHRKIEEYLSEVEDR